MNPAPTPLEGRSTPRRSKSSPAPRLLEGSALHGYNAHHRAMVFTQNVDLGSLAAQRSSAWGSGFVSRFIDRFGDPTRTDGESLLRPAFVEALQSGDGLGFGDILLEAILSLEKTVATLMRRLDSPAFFRAFDATPPLAQLVWECHSPGIARASAQAAFSGLLELLPAELGIGSPKGDEGFDALLARLHKRALRRQWSPVIAELAWAAKQRGLPHESLAGAYLRVGDGVLQQVVSESALLGARDAATRVELAGTQALERILPAVESGRVPTALVVGERGTISIARQLERLLRASGLPVGLATRKQTTILGKPLDPTSLGRSSGAEFLLRDPRLGLLVNANSPRRIMERGLRLDHSTVTAVLDPVAEANLARYDEGVAVALAATTGTIVLNAKNPRADAILGQVEANRLLLVAPSRRTLRVTHHLAAGGCAALHTLRKGIARIEFHREGEMVASIPVADLRARNSSRDERRILQALFTAALAFGLGHLERGPLDA